MPPPRNVSLNNRWRNRQERMPVPPRNNPGELDPMGMPWEVLGVDEAVQYPSGVQEVRDSIIRAMRLEPQWNQALNFAESRSEVDRLISSFLDYRATAVSRQIATTHTPPPRVVEVEFDDSSRRIQQRATERPRGYWKLRNGKFIAISEMDDEHLNNCIRMCERNSQARGRRADPTAPGVYQELWSERNARAARLSEHTMMLHAQQEQARMELENRERRIREEEERGRRGEEEPLTRLRWRANVWSVQPVPPRVESEPEVTPFVPEGAPKRRIKK